MACPPPVTLVTPEIPQSAPLRTAQLGMTEDLSPHRLQPAQFYIASDADLSPHRLQPTQFYIASDADLSPHRLQPTQSYIASDAVPSGIPVPTFADNLGGSFAQASCGSPVPTFAGNLGGGFVQALDETLPSSPPRSSAHLLAPSRSYVAEAAPPRLPAAEPTSATPCGQQPMWQMLTGSGVQVTQRQYAAAHAQRAEDRGKRDEDEEADNLDAWAAFLDDEEPEVETLPSDLDLQALSEEQLMQMLEERRRAVESLQEEIDETRRHPGRFEARLARLEQIFGRVRPSDIIEVRASALLQISEALGQAHLMDQANIAQQSELTPGNKARSQRFLLGRDYLPLDQLQIASDKAAQELKTNHHHPMVKGLHYSGHMAAEMPDIDTRVVLAGGAEEQRAVNWSGSGYWLQHLADTGGEYADDAPASKRNDAEEFVSSVRGPDGEAVDWLGRMKRGWPVPKPHPKESWQPPSWMY